MLELYVRAELRIPVMAIRRNVVEEARFNKSARLPYELRLHDFQMAMQDVYDFFY